MSAPVWNVGGLLLIRGMEDIRSDGAATSVPEVFPEAILPDIASDLDAEFGADFDAMIASWAAEQARLDGRYSEAEECLDGLQETRMVIANLQAREQRLLARLEVLALESADPPEGAPASGMTREIAWRSMVAEVAVATRQADRTVQTAMGRASTLVSLLPTTLDALECGRIAIGHARVILEHASGITADALPEYEAIVVAQAEGTTPGKLAAAARIAAARLRPGTFEDRHAAARELRSVSIHDLDEGMSELSHVVPTVFAAAIFDRLTRQAKAVAATGDPRSRDQLRADLMTDLMLTGEPACGDGAPHTAAQGIRAEVALVIPAMTVLGQADEPATLLGRGPIDLETALRLTAQSSELTRLLTHPVSGMLISADTYRISASLRRYLEQRDRHCRFPVCNRDARYADIDHTIPWEYGGRSVPENLAVLCRGHHTLKHHGNWKVKQVVAGVLEWTSPLGRVVTNYSNGPTFSPVGARSSGDAGPPGLHATGTSLMADGGVESAPF